MENRIKACIPRVRTTATCLALVSNPTPMPASTNGTAMPSERINPSSRPGTNPTRGSTSQGKTSSKKLAFNFWRLLQR